MSEACVLFSTCGGGAPSACGGSACAAVSVALIGGAVTLGALALASAAGGVLAAEGGVAALGGELGGLSASLADVDEGATAEFEVSGAAAGAALTSASDSASVGAAYAAAAKTRIALAVQHDCSICVCNVLLVTGLFQIVGAYSRAPYMKTNGARRVSARHTLRFSTLALRLGQADRAMPWKGRMLVSLRFSARACGSSRNWGHRVRHTLGCVIELKTCSVAALIQELIVRAWRARVASLAGVGNAGAPTCAGVSGNGSTSARGTRGGLSRTTRRFISAG